MKKIYKTPTFKRIDLRPMSVIATSTGTFGVNHDGGNASQGRAAQRDPIFGDD